MATRKHQPPKRPIGRPTEYRESYNEEAYGLCLLGYTIEELGQHFGVSKQTICDWENRYPEFYESIKRGGKVADVQVAQALYKRATGWSHKAVKIFKTDTPQFAQPIPHIAPDGSTIPPNADPPVTDSIPQVERSFEHEYIEYYPPDFQSMRLWLMNRQSARWRDRSEKDQAEKPDRIEELKAIMRQAKVDASEDNNE